MVKVARNGVEIGSYTIDEILVLLSRGELLPSDYGIKEGDPDWVHLFKITGERLVEFSSLELGQQQEAIEKEEATAEGMENYYDDKIRAIKKQQDELKHEILSAKEAKKKIKNLYAYLGKLSNRAWRKEQEREKLEEARQEEEERAAEIREAAETYEKLFEIAKEAIDLDDFILKDEDRNLDADTEGEMSEAQIDREYKKIWNAMKAAHPSKEDFLEMGKIEYAAGNYDPRSVIMDYLTKKPRKET
jgi:hypothetical protein